jgi:hypothetical protein
VSDVGYNGHRNGIFDNFVSVDFHWHFDPNVVGAARREAHPGLRFSRSGQMREPLASETTHDERPTMHQKAAGFSGGLIIGKENALGVF